MSRPRIVLADDYEPLASACQKLLQRGYDVVEVVGSGEAALAVVCEHDPDVLVLDLSMPGLSGVDVARELTGRGVRTRILMLSFHADPAVIERAFAAGALGYVAKTRIALDLLPAVRAVLAGKRFPCPLRDQGNADAPEL